ncbi:response regulator transcription factor [uncultured Psychroserpens sp.]|uniref:response regulator transcription factor n=1 Tax=uncultured Psychroserpens sp. TaxID=255436 RepID=UPI0026137144|nr:helix-turn-helix transcriptional regulator [uncultured Psychroserpens sp.]
MSNEIIIAETTIDNQGSFHFSTKALPSKDKLYRIHLSKKDTPAASLIIGGKEENHIFFIANSNSYVYVENKDKSSLFEGYTIKGYQPNNDLKKIIKMIHQREQSDANDNALKVEFINKTLCEKLLHIADTSSHPIVSLYALNNSKFETTFFENQKFYESYLKKWNNEDSAYFKELRTKFPKKENSSSLRYIFISIVFFILGFLINYYMNQKQKRTNNQLRLLSVQERKIFKLVQSGKSNKEISEEYNIEISTVKSHVSNIYSKLSIKSRKEAMNIK